MLAEHADEPVDLARVVAMVLVHDLVEIDAGDTFAYDETGYETKAAREQAAADRLFGLLPDGQGAELRALWEEHESGVTAEARFANALDRLQPVLLNHAAGTDAPWARHGITYEQIVRRNVVDRRRVARRCGPRPTSASPRRWPRAGWPTTGPRVAERPAGRQPSDGVDGVDDPVDLVVGDDERRAPGERLVVDRPGEDARGHERVPDREGVVLAA